MFLFFFSEGVGGKGGGVSLLVLLQKMAYVSLYKDLFTLLYTRTLQTGHQDFFN